jgi:hypothetical protein
MVPPGPHLLQGYQARDTRATHCAGFRRAARLDRRRLLGIGGLAGFELLLPGLLRAREQPRTGPRTFGRAKSVILLFLNGGHAQQETFDPKPDAPAEARGEFDSVATSVPGVRFGELLPLSAGLMHKLAVVRSMSHRHPDHIQASLPTLTGHHHPENDDLRGDFPPSPGDFPPFGAVVQSLRRGRGLPSWIQVGPLMRRNNGTILHGQFPGFLGNRNGPLVIDQDLLPADVRVGVARTDAGVSTTRLSERRDLLGEVDRRPSPGGTGEEQTFNAYQQRAFDLLTSPAIGRAFELRSESAATRDRYGRTQFGQCCLLARRLAEAEVPMINVHYCRTPIGSWDTHGQHFPQMKKSLCPTFDRAFSALVSDLDERGLLGQTLVLATAEFGRTPKVNKSGGRDHWPRVYSIALAGGGVAAGIVHGSSDRLAAAPTSHPHDPRDIAATVYHLLGVPPDTVVRDPTGRPHQLIDGQKIDAIFL